MIQMMVIIELMRYTCLIITGVLPLKVWHTHRYMILGPSYLYLFLIGTLEQCVLTHFQKEHFRFERLYLHVYGYRNHGSGSMLSELLVQCRNFWCWLQKHCPPQAVCYQNSVKISHTAASPHMTRTPQSLYWKKKKKKKKKTGVLVHQISRRCDLWWGRNRRLKFFCVLSAILRKFR